MGSSSRSVKHLFLVGWHVTLIDTMYDWILVQLVDCIAGHGDQYSLNYVRIRSISPLIPKLHEFAKIVPIRCDATYLTDIIGREK